ncbi:lipase 3-like [Battus philenor]|uniref:lipase 3-like n=1 Tax=Battus philenor TaxID=42288 RepID=UPI0035CFDD2D
MFPRATLLAALVISCAAQNFDLFPGFAASTRELVDSITKLPFVRQVTQTSGDLFSESVNAFSSFPLAIARSFGVSYGLPTLASDTNIVDATEKVVAEYNSGLENEDVSLTITQLISKYGYPVESHQVVTDDGYVLTMHRIPNNGSVVFLMHGLLGASDDFVVSGPESGLAYLLAADGFDVWMGNARGNKHSRRHRSLNPSQAVFWDFSWHEIGCYDLPVMIDYVLKTTNTETLKYIGHSQGTTSFFVMASEKPNYNDKVSLMVALSPVVYMTHVKAPIVRLLSPGTPLLHTVLKSLGVYEILPHNSATKLLRQFLCGAGPMEEILCSNILFLFFGFDFGQLNATNLPVLYSHMPSGASGKQFVHYGQGIVSGDFRQFDYGEVENLDTYGSKTPPSYPLENVRAPVALFYSDSDWLADPRDVDHLHRRLSNVADVYKVPNDQFSHLDFITAKDLKSLIYIKLKKLLRSF